jgi:hypothetical protein
MSESFYTDGGHSSCEFNCFPSPAEGSVHSHVYRVVMSALTYEWDRGRYGDFSSSHIQYHFTGLYNCTTRRSWGILKKKYIELQSLSRSISPNINSDNPKSTGKYFWHLNQFICVKDKQPLSKNVYSIYYTAEALSMAAEALSMAIVLNEDFHPHLALTWCERVQYSKTIRDL